MGTGGPSSRGRSRTTTRSTPASRRPAAGGAGTPERPAREDDPPHPLNAYGRTKAAAESAIRSDARVPWTILRPCSVYGPRDRQWLPLVRLAARGRFLVAAPPAMAFTL